MFSSSSAYILAFLALLNPFALFLYLQPVMSALSRKDFLIVLAKASLISFLIFYIFSLTGTFLFEDIFRIHFESFRIFGGIIIFAQAFLFVVQGRLALLGMKESLDDLASEIALPFFVGAGTISVSILIGSEFNAMEGFSVLFLILFINYICIFVLMMLRELFSKKLKVAFDKVMGILLRLSGFFIGAVGLDMVVTGIRRLFF
ncbi:MAG: MarC family protein [Candidatus Niyogibacteria bacterium CG10_big_fil_rev_8_21_14_0_10_46_36]|uniref:UPF0056 membrane protein n=1 Tax=Candidatus Niyogibacteria bacterium CG10_big_fil_rev_8_21_14_0_10_46_36 TaxID=1974726 RepID=A0A2H0TFL5_9BACT|nr:MAG: MarC family protein [Candidatus Niyogibacteria bacterium CG10_big_fil_rev_8_21_14_0_10_46_36]